ncbi:MULTISPECIES: hypothetical protein [unclassified Arcicella]|uniref:hypothetical protein n=1 Tax=unclassified Arcicella TaxID=2644986 RepID=UPI002854D922|nr:MULTISPECIES: hypothetical protein [unclassified Arcicella]MDR6564647.1 hypothetical protein [Arcicella sp. BE51]MDR6814425.1 hypothetical protein [Arcicella sp. BE140]MDR6825819.1 hypothetical protein [Arcicella sp. BE139]
MSQQPSLPNSTAGLYNALCDALHISNQQFQMIQGVLPVQTTPEGVYNFVDGIPPESVATLYTNNPINGLNGNMQIVISDAKPSFLSKLAENNYFNPKYWVDGNIGTDPIYAPAFADLYNQVNAGSSATIYFDSATANSDISSSWAKSTSSAGVGFWGTSSSSVSTELNEKASSSRITVTITLNKYAYLQVRAGGWFTQGFFTDQYKNPSKWTGGQDAWDQVFGPSGSCQNVSNQVLLVNGYTITTTSYASYSEYDFQQIQKSSQTNVWPFYTSSSNSIATQSHSYNADQTITTTIGCNPGSLQIFGMGVIPTSFAMGGVSHSRLI